MKIYGLCAVDRTSNAATAMKILLSRYIARGLVKPAEAKLGITEDLSSGHVCAAALEFAQSLLM